ncbi:MAG: Glutamate synthase [NADPH] large chain [Candidatus Heimdallarchaeota archaeon LC_2]|nr:MAG: Glutamate synthase [NADPH] large chain [Candidatus Heimdallarchaeota archaeon LC_2]
MSTIKIQQPNLVKIANFDELEEKIPFYALVLNTDLVVIKFGGQISVLYGRCLHRGALLADGKIEGKNLICGVHGWDYQFKTGVSEYNKDEVLRKFNSWVKDNVVWVDQVEIESFELENPQTFIDRKGYLGLYAAEHWKEAAEPELTQIRKLAVNGLVGEHGPVGAMGVSREFLPNWYDIQILPAQLHKFPLLDKEPVNTSLRIGKNSKQPLDLAIPLFVSDMSFGSLSEPAKIALARGAENAGTGICSGEGGMLSEEQQENSRYFYEYASGKFGFGWDKIKKVQAFHFKGGQAAKTGTGGHLPGYKVVGKIAQVRNLEEGKSAISPAKFVDFKTLDDFKAFATKVRDLTNGIPIGFKLSANHIEKDIEAALEVGVDYIILDGRGGGTGAAPLIFRDNISVPTMAALGRARKFLDEIGDTSTTLIITGGLRTAPDFVKALALGADGIAVANSAIQAIGCQGMRACHTNNCPVGIATQKPNLTSRIDIDLSAKRLEMFFKSTVDLMKVLARACGHNSLNEFEIDDLTTFKKDIADLTGIQFGGVNKK